MGKQLISPRLSSYRVLGHLSLTIGLCILGCTHPLTVKNLGVYQSHSITPMATERSSIGIISNTTDPYMKRIVKSAGQSLASYNAEVVLPYTPQGSRPVDYEARIGILPTYDGSGWNFLINFPGFILFAPAWHGYIYKVNYQIDVTLTDSKQRKPIDSFKVPIDLDLRHAEFDRTWTEISWLEVGIIAFIGGIYFTQYDPDVTPLVTEKVSPTIGDYIAQEIINRINSYRGNSPRVTRSPL